MKLWSTTVAAVLGLACFASAAPTPTEDIVARACKTLWPAYARVDEARPNESYLPGVTISQGTNKVNRQDTFFEFKTPDNSYGCQLEAYLPVGFNIWGSGTEANRRVNVYAVEAPLSRSPHGIDISWNYCPAPGALVGTLTFRPDANKPVKTVINSFQCKQYMAYRFAIANEITGYGSVGFVQGDKGGGIRMVYNC